MTSGTALSVTEKRIQAKKQLALQKLRQFSNPKPVPYKPSADGKDNIFVEKTGETLTAPAGTGQVFSQIQNDDVFDTPSGVLEETVAQFEKQAAYIALVSNAYGLVSDDDVSQFVADRSRALASAQRRAPAYVKRFNEDFENAEGFFETTGVILSNPRAIGRQTVTQVANSSLPLLTTFAGAAAGSGIPVVGTAVGGAAGAFVGGSITEVGAQIDQLLLERGIDTTNADQVLAALQDDALVDDIRSKAQAKGLTTAAVDALFQVVGARFLKAAPAGATRVQRAGRFAGDVGVQAVGEGVGEAAGQFAAFGEVDVKDAALEAITSISQSAGQTAIAAGFRGGRQVVGPTAQVVGEGVQAARQAAETLVQPKQVELDTVSEQIEVTDFEALAPQEADALAENFDILEAERDQISAIAEQQIQEIERQEQAQVTQEARQIRDVLVDASEAQRQEGRLAARSLSSVIAEKGGIENVSDVLTERGVDGRSARRVAGKPDTAINKEQMKEALFEEGFFADKNSAAEITDTELFGAIEQDLRGNRVLRQEDQQQAAQISQRLGALTELEQRGIAQGQSIEQISDTLRQERGLLPDAPQNMNKTEPFEVGGVITEEYKNNVQKLVNDRLANTSNKWIPSFFDRKRRRLQSDGRNFIRDFQTGIEKAISPISTRIKNISQELFVRMRRFEFEMKRDIIANNKELEPFLRSMKQLSNEDFIALDFALKNGNEPVIEQIANKYGIQDQVEQVRNMLDDIFERATNAGIDINYRSTFFPRRISDVDGLLDYLRGAGAWNVFKDAIDSREQRLGRALNEAERAALVNNLLRGFTIENVSLSKKGIFKDRTIEEVTVDIDQFYETTDQALLQYVISANEAIAASRLFGKGIDIDGASNIDDSVGSLVDDLTQRKGLSSTDARNLRDMLSARFNEKRMGWISSSFRNLTYIDVMGSPLNAITQIGDLTTSAYNSGILNAVAEIPASVTEKGQISLDDIGIDRIAQEFEGRDFTSKAVDKVFKATGLNKIDRIGKLNLVNSTLKKQQSLARKNDADLMSKLDVMFGENAEQVRQDLADGNITEDVKFLAFNTLLDMQPVAQSEMPEYYLRSGNLKLLYMLKTFTIKQLDIYRREVVSELRQAFVTGNPKQAARAAQNFVRLAGYWITLGATADYIKDLLRSLFGDDEVEEPEDYLIDNTLKAFGFSKYQLNMVGKQGATEVFFDIFKPPTKWYDNLEKDFKRIQKDGELNVDNSRAIRSVPVGGELFYFWFGAGSGGESTSGRRRDL